MEVWHRRHALQIAMQLPEGTDDALLVLDAARQLVTGFLNAEKPQGAVLTLVSPKPVSDVNRV
jgi:hypothetical protein